MPGQQKNQFMQDFKPVCQQSVSVYWLLVAFLLLYASFPPLLHAEESVGKPTGTGAKYELIDHYDINKLNTVLTKEMADFTDLSVSYTPASNAVNLYRVSYPSVIPEQGNKPIMAYGLVAIPETGKKAMPVISYQHGTVYHKRQTPSIPEESFETRLMIAQFAGQGYVVIAADYFGMGASTEKQGFIVKDSHQQACLDMYYSALAVLARENIKMTDFFVTGWSQGGFVALAFLEKLENFGIPVKAASTASAPNDAFALVNGIFFYPRKIDAGWLTTIISLMAFSFEEYYGIPDLAKNLINPDQYEIARQLYMDDPKFNIYSFPTDMHKLIRPEYFNPNYLADSAFGKRLKEAQAFRWLVKTPLRAYYGESDEVIPIHIGKFPMTYQQTMGNTQVEALSAGPVNHHGTYAYAVAEQKKWFDTLLTH